MSVEPERCDGCGSAEHPTPACPEIPHVQAHAGVAVVGTEATQKDESTEVIEQEAPGDGMD